MHGDSSHSLLWTVSTSCHPQSMSSTMCSLSCPQSTGPPSTWKDGTPHRPALTALHSTNITVHEVHKPTTYPTAHCYTTTVRATRSPMCVVPELLLDMVGLRQGNNFFPHSQLLQNFLQHKFFSNVSVILPNGFNYTVGSNCDTYALLQDCSSNTNQLPRTPLMFYPCSICTGLTCCLAV